MNLNKRHITGSSGFTLVELMVAISLGLFVATLIFSGYTMLFKGFRNQAKRAESVQEMISVKGKIERCTRSIELIKMVSPGRISFVDRTDHAEHSLSFRDSSLWKDTELLYKGIGKCAFTPSTNLSSNGFRLIEYECVLKQGGWVGGVIVAREE